MCDFRTCILYWGRKAALSAPVRLSQGLSVAQVAYTGDTGDVGLIPGLGRSPGKGKGNPLHYSCLKKPMDRGGLQFMGSQRVERD